MAKLKELIKIKKMYGENFMKLCRLLFPSILEIEGRLYEILTLSFSENCKTLYEDIINNNIEEKFKNFIYSKINTEELENKIIVTKTPYELLEEAGYDLIECTTEEEIQSFKKYYDTREVLCTFNGGRLNWCVVFFAVRKDVENIKREDFEKPEREDEYGTSVLGIQFNKVGICTVSIKNRYNHTVNNPDATYGNDLDKIMVGLTQSFEELLRKRGLMLNRSNIERFQIPGYVVANDGKYYKYNMEINGRYYCPGNIIIEYGQIHKLENPEKQILIDYFILDMEKKILQIYDPRIEDSFKDTFEQLEKIEIRRDKKKGNGERTISIKKSNQNGPIIIQIDKNNQIIGYKNPELIQVGNKFLFYNRGLTQLELPNLEQVGSSFLYNNEVLLQLQLPSLEQVGGSFLYNNEVLLQLQLPSVIQVESKFLYNNRGLKQLELPNLIQVAGTFLYENRGLIELKLPNLIRAGSRFLYNNMELTQLELPSLALVGRRFLNDNRKLIQLKLVNLIQVDDYFLPNNKVLTQLELPNLIQAGNSFLPVNKGIIQLRLPNLAQVGNSFLYSNIGLMQLEISKLIQVGNDFLYCNNNLTCLDLPNLIKAGKNFLNSNKKLERLYLPKLPELREKFLDIIDENLNNRSVILDAKNVVVLDKEENER